MRLSFFVFFIFCCNLSGFAQTTDTFLHGVWTVEDVAVYKAGKNKLSLPDSVKNRYMQALFIFKNDNRFTLRHKSHTTPEAVWKYDRHSKTISISEPDSTSKTASIMKIKLANSLDGSARFILEDKRLKLKVRNAWRTYIP